MQMVRTASRFRLSGSVDQPPFKRMSGELQVTWRHVSGLHELTGGLFLSPVILEDYVYAVTVSGQKVFVVKRQNNQQEPISV